MLRPKAIKIHPMINGRLLICIERFLPNTSANIPERMLPNGFVTAPKLAKIKLLLVIFVFGIMFFVDANVWNISILI